MSVGPIEIVIVLVLALLIFGPTRLPQMGRQVGRGVREFRNAANTARTELGLDGVTKELDSVKSSINDLKSSVDLKSAIEAPVPADDAVSTPGTVAAAAAAARAASAELEPLDDSSILMSETGEPQPEPPAPSQTKSPAEPAEPSAAADPEPPTGPAAPEAPAAPPAPEAPDLASGA